MVILASDFSGLIEGLIWWVVNSFYLLMLLITAISCIGRRHTRATDDLTRSLVVGGIVMVFSVALAGWQLLGRTNPDWSQFRFYALSSAALWVGALLLLRLVRR